MIPKETARFDDGSLYTMRDNREVARVEPRGNLIEQLFREPGGAFVRVSSRLTVDGVPLDYDEDGFETHPELYRGHGDPAVIAERKRRLGIIRRASRLTLPEAIRWAVVTHVPDSLVGAVLDCLTLPSAGEVRHE